MNLRDEDALRRRALAAARVGEAETADEAARRYEAEYFPAALAAMAAEAEPVDVLVATVGTQPYSVALSLTRTPARVVYLVHTDESAASVARALALAGDRDVRTRHVGKADSVAVYEAIRDIVERHAGEAITIDFTSGTKAMTAGASTVAGYLRLRQIYVESERISRAFPWFGLERAHVVEHPLVVFGDLERVEAERAFDRGLFDVAERLFRGLDAARAPGFHFGARARLCGAYAAWSALRFGEAERAVREVAQDLGRASRRMLPKEPLLDATARLDRQAEALALLGRATDRAARPAFDADLVEALSRFLLATARRRSEREPDLAALLLYRCLELSLQRLAARHGIDVGDVRPDAPAALLERYNAACRPEHRLALLPDKLALSQTRTLLRALGDPVLAGLRDVGDARFEGLLNGRNKSILAHGFRTLEARELDQFRAVVLEHARAVAAADGREAPADADPVYDFVPLAGGG